MVRKYDGEFPKKYFKDVLEYMDIPEDLFWETINRFRPTHLWAQRDGEWCLKQQVK